MATHTFLVYKEKDSFFYFENSFHQYRGIWGPFSSVAPIVEKVYQQMEDKRPCGKGYKWAENDPQKLLRGDIDIVEYLLISGYDFNKA
jgi:hypothetical protein